MKRIVGFAAGGMLLLLLAGTVFAMGPMGGRMGMGHGMMGGGPGMMGMGPGMMGGPGMAGCPGMMGMAPATALTEEQAKEKAQAYADKYLPGFTVEKVLPFGGPMHTMYSVELTGPKDESRILHINPFGAVMPFGGPWRRGT
jgi:hypothetical protein